jgi:membrane fusion protein (multidrug efflux system)
MYDPASLSIRAAVSEKYAAAVKSGIIVEVRLDAYPGKTVTGKIDRVYPYLDDRLRTRTMEISLDEPLDLLPGMFARLTVQLETVDNSVVVPLQAVLFTPKGKVVFVVQEGKAVRRLVNTGIEEGDRIQLVSGVSAGEKIIVAGNERLKDGIAVMVAGSNKNGKPGASPSTAPKNDAGDPSQ